MASEGAAKYAAMFNREPTASEEKFFALRESGYKGWIDQNGDAVGCPCCGSSSCTAGLAEKCNG